MGSSFSFDNVKQELSPFADVLKVSYELLNNPLQPRCGNSFPKMWKSKHAHPKPAGFNRRTARGGPKVNAR